VALTHTRISRGNWTRLVFTFVKRTGDVHFPTMPFFVQI